MENKTENSEHTTPLNDSQTLAGGMNREGSPIIGIGVTTYNRPAHLELFLKQIEKHTTVDCDLYIAHDDLNRKGIAYRKNECLKALQHCDYIFLFDDDCFPVEYGWIDFFIMAHKASGHHHFLYLKETSSIKKIGIQNFELESFVEIQIEQYNNCGGCMMFLTKEVIEKVGGFNKEYGLYGMEHAGYTKRIHAAGLTPMGEYLCPAGSGEYIYAMDYDSHLPFNKAVNHAPSMIKDMAYIDGYIKQNRLVYEKDIAQVYQPL